MLLKVSKMLKFPFSYNVKSDILLAYYCKILFLSGCFPFSVTNLGLNVKISKLVYSYILFFGLALNFLYTLRKVLMIGISTKLAIAPCLNLLNVCLYFSSILSVNERQNILKICFNNTFCIRLDTIMISIIKLFAPLISVINSLLYTRQINLTIIRILLLNICYELSSYSCSAEFILASKTAVSLLPSLSDEWAVFKNKYLKCFNLFKQVNNAMESYVFLLFCQRTARLLFLSYIVIQNDHGILPLTSNIIMLLGFFFDSFWFYSQTHSITQQVKQNIYNNKDVLFIDV